MSDPSVTIRMYRVGLGDCHLLSFKTGNETRHKTKKTKGQLSVKYFLCICRSFVYPCVLTVTPFVRGFSDLLVLNFKTNRHDRGLSAVLLESCRC